MQSDLKATMVSTGNNGRVYADRNYDRFVGWRGGLPGFENLYSKATIALISKKITSLLAGVDPDGKSIVVTPDNITAALSSVYENYQPIVGDIHSRFIIGAKTRQHYLNDIADRAINIIVRQVRDMILTENKNRGLSVWTSVLSDDNPHGIRAHPIIKLREKRPDPMQFHMRY